MTNFERLRVNLILMIFIHALHLGRLIFVWGSKTYKVPFKGCLHCVLVDCYCCVGTVIYFYVQWTWWKDHGECRETLPNITVQMKVEIWYQYLRVCWYLFTNICVVFYIMYI